MDLPERIGTARIAVTARLAMAIRRLVLARAAGSTFSFPTNFFLAIMTHGGRRAAACACGATADEGETAAEGETADEGANAMAPAARRRAASIAQQQQRLSPSVGSFPETSPKSSEPKGALSRASGGGWEWAPRPRLRAGTTTNSQPGVGGGCWEGWGLRPDVICLRRRIRLVRLCVVWVHLA